jgi:hypothetical protein
VNSTGGVLKTQGAKGKFDRTPSFFTSRSIVNLSGLSVSDPAPVHTGSHTPRDHNMNNSHKMKQVDDTLLEEVNEVEEEEKSLHIPNSVAADANQHTEGDDDFWNLSVKSGEVPLSAANDERTPSADITRVLSSDNLKEDHTMHK